MATSAEVGLSAPSDPATPLPGTQLDEMGQKKEKGTCARTRLFVQAFFFFFFCTGENDGAPRPAQRGRAKPLPAACGVNGQPGLVVVLFKRDISAYVIGLERWANCRYEPPGPQVVPVPRRETRGSVLVQPRGRKRAAKPGPSRQAGKLGPCRGCIARTWSQREAVLTGCVATTQEDQCSHPRLHPPAPGQ